MIKKSIIRTSGCNLCGSQEAELVTDSLRFDIKRNVVRCLNCHLVYLFPLMSAEEERKLYEEEYRNVADVEGHYLPQEAQGFFEAELGINAERFARVARFITPSMKVLEIGCAAGSFLHCAKGKVAECTGVELHKSFASFVRDKLGIPTYDLPLEECGFSPGSNGSKRSPALSALLHPDPCRADRRGRPLLAGAEGEHRIRQRQCLPIPLPSRCRLRSCPPHSLP